MVRLSEVKGLGSLLCGGAEELRFSGVVCDSREVRPGDLFVAVRGGSDDGVRYAAAALERGAVGVVSEVSCGVEGGREVVVRDARQALGLLSAAANGYPSEYMAVYGVTGTNGKSTTALIIREILRQAGYRTGLLSTVEVAYGERVVAATHTTPGAPLLQHYLGAMVEHGCSAVVMEVSSHAIEQQRVAGVRFGGVVFTNLSQDHLDYHGSMEEYFRVKQELFARVAQESPGAVAVVLAEGEYGSKMESFVSGLPLRLVSCGFESGSDLWAEIRSMRCGGSEFDLVTRGGERVRVGSRLTGRFNVANMLCAAGLAYGCGVGLEVVARGLEGVEPCWGRLEEVKTPLGCTVYVDYAHTDDALRSVLTAVREVSDGRLVVVFGCGGDRDRTKRPLMGRACAEVADVLVVTSDNPRSESPGAIIADILGGIPAGAAEVVVEEDRRLGIRRALQLAGEGDVVVVAGKGHESWQEAGGERVPFDDRQVVREEAEGLWR